VLSRSFDYQVMIPRFLHRIAALFLACIFFLFQTELDHEEYLRNHRQVSSAPSIAAPSLTWETFDKQNAPKAFVVVVDSDGFCLVMPYTNPGINLPPSVSVHPVRDKSPPFPAHDIRCS
jgi:hypothetical protein